MNKFLYITSEVFKREASLATIGLLLITLAISIFILGNLILFIIRRIRKQKKSQKIETNSDNETKTKKKVTLKTKLPYIITTLFALTVFLTGSAFTAYPYIKLWDLEYKEFNLDSLSKKELRKLGLLDIYVDRTIDTKEVADYEVSGKHIKFLSTPERSFNENEIKIIVNIIENLPQNFLDDLPDTIEFISYIEYDGYVAWALGNQIYYSNTTFDEYYSYREFEHTTIHELVHVAQYNKISEDVIKEHLFSGKKINLEKDSEYVIKYAESAGWELTDNEEGYVIDPDLEMHKTSEYGKAAGPIEDMAEAISYYLIGETALLSEGRMNWVDEYLGDQAAVKHQIPRMDNYSWIISIPKTTYGYYMTEETYDMMPENYNEPFTIDMKKDKDIKGDKYMIKTVGYQQNKKPEKYNDELKKWKDTMSSYGWKLENEKNYRGENNVKFTELIYTGPQEKTIIKIEDRREFSNKDSIDAKKRTIREYESWGYDASYYKDEIDTLKEKQNNVKDQGIFVEITWGVNI